MECKDIKDCAEKIPQNAINQFSRKILQEIKNDETTFIFVDVEKSLEYKVFLDLLKQTNKQVFEERRFINRAGETRFVVCSVVDKGSPESSK